ncbi:MAG: efflux RND transporter permease subunit [Cyclobacteriaceae bacterium]|nr:efflux RND transporter permease subunit [Cyclobacteriaceae bacterium]
MLNRIIAFFLENKLVTVLLLLILTGWGIVTAPFNWEINWLPRDPVPVDAIPDIGENQQIVFTEWMGRSPRDVEDQITYPLTTSLLGMPGVKAIRSTSMFGFSSIYVIFDDEIEYYWSRSRILEKLNALPSGLLPEDVQPQLGPDATALGQVFMYTLEGRDEEGKPAGGWDLHELRTLQDYYVRYGLASAEGVAEVASVGGHVKEYQIDLDPVAMKAYDISLMQIMEAVRGSNLDVGANTVEINLVEYLVRGLGYIESIEDIEESVVTSRNGVAIRIGDIARVNMGPAVRSMTGLLDKGGVETTGGIVVARYGDNPLQVIANVKKKIEEISPGLPSKRLEDGRISKVTIVPFYDRTGLIYETLYTLYEAINLQILITIIVIVVMVSNLRASVLISALLPLAVLMSFIFMKYVQVDANIVALSGIAIAIGTMVDLGIILSENILKHLESADEKKNRLTVIYEATTEVASAILTAISTTIISFLPVFTLQAAEGKLFGPLAWTKTFALVSALIITLVIIPAFAHWMFSKSRQRSRLSVLATPLLLILAVISFINGWWWAGFMLSAYAINRIRKDFWNGRYAAWYNPANIVITVAGVAWLLSSAWLPLGASKSLLLNFIFVLMLLTLVLGTFNLFIRFYKNLLYWCLENKALFLAIPALIILVGLNIWLGADRIFGFIPNTMNKLGLEAENSQSWKALRNTFPGMGKEFMPALDEGSFLLMPTSMPHSGVDANRMILAKLDMLVQSIPEVDKVVGKAGRAESPLDPAPMSMFENIIHYRPEYISDEEGRKIRFMVNDKGEFMRNRHGELIPDRKGRYFRQWRDHIQTADDIWQEIVNVTQIPGVTSAPKLQPIETRLVMLQTGMRAPMGLKVYGPDLETIERFSLEMEKFLKQVPSVKPEAVYADRSLGKPYLEIKLNRKSMGRYGLRVADVQDYIETALGGMPLTVTVEGRERFAVRARYAREWRDTPESIGKMLIPAGNGLHIPMEEIAEIRYRPGPSMIRGENGFLTGYVLMDKKTGYAEVSVVEEARAFLQEKINRGELMVPAGVSYQFSGSYENQVRAEKRLAIVIPLALAIIFLILYLQFKSTATALMIFTSIAMAFSGGFVMLWLYGQDWFLNFSLFGTEMRQLMSIHPVNLSVAVWVGFLALFGIATDDGVVMGTYLKQSFDRNPTESVEGIRAAVLEAGLKRVRPCLMTSATTLLALLPVLTSTGRGADIMVPMAIPAFGGMTFALISLFVVPVLYALWKESTLKKKV